MMLDETPLEAAERHVRDCEAFVARQKEIVAQQQRDGHVTQDAETLLVAYEVMLEAHREVLERAKAEFASRQHS